MDGARRERLAPVLLALAALGAGITGYLTLEHGRGGAPLCVVGHGCEVIATSAYAHVGPIPSAAFGLFLYLVLGVLFALRLAGPPPEVGLLLRRAAFGLCLAGVIVSAWLTYVAIFSLHATCAWCLGSAATLLALTVLTGLDLRRATR
jgi:uncharacterized membrane protein